MISEQDIRLIENYLFGKLSEQDKIAFEQRLNTDKEFADEVDFMRDLKISANELGKMELRSKLKVIADNYRNNGKEAKQDNLFYYAMAASVIFLIGLGSIMYFLQQKSYSNAHEIANASIGNQINAVDSLINTSLNHATIFNVNSVVDGMGYIEGGQDTTMGYQVPVLVIQSQRFKDQYLFRDTLYLFLTSNDSLHFTSMESDLSKLYFSIGKDSFYYVLLKKDAELSPIKKVEDKDLINKIR